MLEIEVTQEPSGGWNVRHRVEEGEWDTTQVRNEDLGAALKALGDNLPELIVEAQA